MAARASTYPGVRFQVISEPLTIFRVEDARPSVSRALDWQFSLAWARESLFVCVSENIRQTALERGFPAGKLWVHRIGIDLQSSELARSPGPQPVVLFVGRLVEKKGCAHLIRAMALVNAKLPGARLVVVGEGPLRSELESQARTQSPSAVFLGSQPSQVVRTCMRRAGVLAAPSVVAKNGDTEGLPIVLCEAQAMGLPIASFRGPGVDEAVIDGQTAMLVNSGDHEALAAMILRLLADASLRAQLCVGEGSTPQSTSTSAPRPRCSKTNTTRSSASNERASAAARLRLDRLRPVRVHGISGGLFRPDGPDLR